MNSMFRTIAAAILALAIAAPAQAGKDKQPTPSVPSKDRKALEQTLDKIWQSVPAVSKEYQRDRDGDAKEVHAPVGAKSADGVWRVPAGARGSRAYVKATGTGDDAQELRLEINVYVNLESSLGDPLGSEGGTMRIEDRDGVPFVRHQMAGVEGTRLALELSDEAKANALTVVRAYVAKPEAADYVADLIQGHRPDANPWEGVPATGAAQVRTIVVEFHGPASEVDRLAAATRVSNWKALLAP
jgi:hypothetical protein